MWLLGISVVLLLMKWLEFGPVASWSWWWIVLSFCITMLWFEFLEPWLGRDKKKAHDTVEKNKQERIRKQFEKKSR